MTGSTARSGDRRRDTRQGWGLVSERRRPGGAAARVPGSPGRAGRGQRACGSRRVPASARDEGTAGVLVLAMVLVLVAVGSVVTGLASVAVARQRAASAADLSALAAAAASLDGPAAACRRATELAAQVAARLVSCTLDGDVADVVAEVRPAGAVGRFGAASARARAGPVGVPP